MSLGINEEYHILCGLNIELGSWHSYGGEKFNLKSAQMDFVLVSCKGIFLIEVKNWSKHYYNKSTNLSPHEQLDRGGRVLYNFLGSKLEHNVAIQRNIKKILIPIQSNIPYNPDYKFVWVLRLDEINYFISSQRDVLSDYEVKRIIAILNQFVTYK